MVAAALGMGVSIWDLETGYRIFKAETSDFSWHTSLAWSVDSRRLATASLNHGVQVWDVRSQTKLASLQPHTGSYLALDWSADGQMLATGADEGWAYLLEASDGDLLRQIGSGINVNSLALAPDGQLIALGSEGQTIELWTLDGSLFQSLPGIGFKPSEVRFSANGEFFSATNQEEVGRDRTSVWNTRDWSIASTFFAGPNLDYVVTGFELAPDLQTAAISIVKMTLHSSQDQIQIITFPEGELVTTLAPVIGQAREHIHAAAYSPSGEMFAMFNLEDYQNASFVQVWRTSDWQLLYTFQVVPEQPRSGWTTVLQDSIAWSPDSSLLAVGVRDGSLQIFDAAHGELLVTLPGHRMWATGVAFSPDWRILASCSLDGTIMLWGAR
jgi:WD40 repeat protein